MNKEREVPIRIVVRKRRHAEHHGGAWKVAFADFMTAMFALFLVLWLVNQSSDIKSAIAGYFQDPLGRADEFGSSIMQGDGTQAATVRPLSQSQILELRRDRLRNFADYLEERLTQTPELSSVRRYIEIDLTPEGLTIQLLEDASGVFFETGSAAPSARGRMILGLLGAELGTLGEPVRIAGYTDARPYSGARAYSNWELSADRANHTRRLLGDGGLHPSQVTEIRGFADRELRDAGDPFSPRNRRITITVLAPRESGTPADTAAAIAGALP